MTLYNLYSWGLNRESQCGFDPSTEFIVTPTQINTNNYKKVSCGYYHNVAIDENDNLCTWGNNSRGQLGNNTTDDDHIPTIIDSSYTWIDVSAGRYHTAAINNNNDLYICGDNTQCHINEDTDTPIIKTFVHIASDVQKVECNAYFTAFTNNNQELYFLGRFIYPQLRLQTEEYQQTRNGRTGPLKSFVNRVPYMLSANVTNFFTMSNCIIIQDNDDFYIIGYHPLVYYEYISALDSSLRIFDVNTNSVQQIPEDVQFFPNTQIQKVSSKGNHALMIDDANNLYGFGNNYYFELSQNIPSKNVQTFSTITNNITDISCGNNHSILIDSGNILYGFGLNHNKQIIDNTYYYISQITQIDLNYNLIVSGSHHNIALKEV